VGWERQIGIDRADWNRSTWSHLQVESDRAKVLMMPINIDDVRWLLAATSVDETKVVFVDSCVSATPSLLVAQGSFEKLGFGITKWLSERLPERKWKWELFEDNMQQTNGSDCGVAGV